MDEIDIEATENYFNKIAKADVFVVLDDVQFRRRYFQNRAKIKAGDSEKLITIPLKKHAQSTLIKDIQIEKRKNQIWYNIIYQCRHQ